MDNMNIRHCKKCGRLYQYDGEKLCMKCRNDEEDEFYKVREYLYDNPNASIVETSEETGVDEEKILKYLRDGRLELKGENLLLECERCGTPIPTGRYCSKCVKEMQNELLQVAKGMDKKNNSKTREDRMFSQGRKK